MVISMTNNEKLYSTFSKALGISLEEINEDLKYNSINQWDSIAHMTLVAELETEFDVMFDTDQIIDMSSVAKAREILELHEVSF